MKSGRASWQEEEETRKDFIFVTDQSGQDILYLQALQGHSGRNLIDPSLQDNVLIPDDFFKYIYHVGCANNLHTIIISGLIPGGQNLSKRQTVFFLPLNPMNKGRKDPETVDQFTEQGDLLRQNKRPVRVLRKSTHVSHLVVRVPNCLLNVKIKNKDTDESVDADRVRTGRPVGGHQSPSSRRWTSILGCLDCHMQ